MSSAMRALELLGPITLAMIVSAMVARTFVRQTRLMYSMIAIATAASLVTVVDVVVLNHFMVVTAGEWGLLILVALYSLGAGIAAAMIVARTTTNAIGRLVATAENLDANQLDARAGDVHASPELQMLGAALDDAAARLAQALEAERRIESQRRDLMTSISHDLRTPLANLRAMVEAISDGVVEDPAVVRRYSDEMQVSIMRLVEMVDDLFDLAQIDAAGFADDPGKIPLSELVQRAVDLAEPAAATRRITIESALDGAAATPCSPRFSRVVHTLVDNAVRYTPHGGHVRIEAEAGPQSLSISVLDDGDGLPADQLLRVFEPFWRADESRSAGGGSGLGLALARRIVEASGGEIVASSSPGAGSRFDVSIPRRW